MGVNWISAHLPPLPDRHRAGSKAGVAIVGYVSLEHLSAEIANESLPGFSIEDEPFDSAVGDEAIIIHIHTTRGSARATRLMLALFGTLKPDIIALRNESDVGYRPARTWVWMEYLGRILSRSFPAVMLSGKGEDNDRDALRS